MPLQVSDLEGIPEFELRAVFPELFEPTPPQQGRAGRTLDFEAKLFMAKLEMMSSKRKVEVMRNKRKLKEMKNSIK